MIDTNISSGFSSAINSKNKIKTVLKKLNAISDSDDFSTYGEKLDTKITEDKTKLATAITNKGVATSATDSFDTMATNINSITDGGGTSSTDTYLADIGGNVIINDAEALISYFYYAPASATSAPYYGRTLSVSSIILNKVKSMGQYCFWTNKADIFTIKSISCPLLDTVKSNSFYRINFEHLDKDSFPQLTTLGSDAFSYCNLGQIETKDIFPKITEIKNNFNRAEISSETLCFDQVDDFYFTSSKKFFTDESKANIKHFIFPALKFYGSVNDKPNLKQIFNTDRSLVETANFNSTDYSDVNFFNGDFLALKKLCIGSCETFYASESSYNTYLTLVDESLSTKLPNIEYLHMKQNPNYEINKQIYNNLFTNMTNLKYLILTTTTSSPSSILPNLTECKNIKVVIIKEFLGSNTEENFANFKAGLLDTETEKGYLYLDDNAYKFFLQTLAEEGTNERWVQDRTRKWSEYKDLLINQYGLDSIEDWYK